LAALAKVCTWGRGRRSRAAARSWRRWLGDAVDVAQGEGDLDVAALVEVFEGDREGLEGLAPQLVDALFAGAVQHQPAEAEGFLQAAAAFAHQGVVGLDLDADALQLDELGEDVGGPVEEGAGEHRALDPAAFGSASSS
jgi:hypothetical protein